MLEAGYSVTVDLYNGLMVSDTAADIINAATALHRNIFQYLKRKFIRLKESNLNSGVFFFFIREVLGAIYERSAIF